MSLTDVLNEINISLSDTQKQQFEAYADLLLEWNQRMNLTAITDRQDIYVKHFHDSLLLEYLYHPEGTLMDVGSGAGFPGLPLAINNPDLQVTLLEPIEKRCSFLNHVVEQLKLNNVEVVRMRAEEFSGRTFNYVTSRAVAPVNILCELCLPLTAINGHFIAMKGPKATEELKQAQKAIRILGGETAELRELQLPGDQTRVFVDIIKKKTTPQGYPRSYSRIKKKPL